MNIVITEKLRSYMEMQNSKDIVLEISTCNTWAGVSMDVVARLAAENEKINEEHFHKVETPSANVYILKTGIGVEDTLTLSFSNFMWIPRITVSGAYIR